MPIFEYECDRGHVTEVLVPAHASDTSTAICTVCEGEGHTNLADKIMSATPTTFKHADSKAIKRNRT